ncbi:pyridoxamine 5'-phosphate oxidase family protein [soil metagenome]
MTDHTDTKEHFDEILKDFDNAMLVTHDPEGELRARPMAMAESMSSGDLWFATDVTSGKVEEILADPRIAITLQGNGKYLSLTGRATVVHDRQKIRELWTPTWKAWFDDENDPKLGLINIRAREGEFWDFSGVKKKLTFLVDAVSSIMKDGGASPPHPDPDLSAKVKL